MSAPGWGGARPNSGPKGPDHPDAEEDANYAAQRARHEKLKADQREIAVEVERGRLLYKEPIEQASATALAVLTQSLRTLPDNLERVCGLTPEQAELAAQQVDAALTEVSAAFRAMAEAPK